MPSTSYRYMQDRRTKKAVLHQEHVAPPNTSSLDPSHLRSLIYSMSGDTHEGVSHAVNYVEQRAPLIGGKKYSGLEMHKMAQSTMKTQPGSRRKKKQRWDEFDPSAHDGSVLAKALSIRLPVNRGRVGGSRADPSLSSSFPNPSSNPNNQSLPPALSPLGGGRPGAASSSMFNPAVFAPPAPELGLPHHPVMNELSKHQSNLESLNTRAKTKKRRRATEQKDGYGAAKPASMQQAPLFLPNPLPFPQPGPDHLPAPASELLCPSPTKAQPQSKLDHERKHLESLITSNAYSLTSQYQHNSTLLKKYAALNDQAVNSLPLNYVFRAAIDRYVRTKTGSAMALWRRFVKIHKAHEDEELYKSLQAEVIQRCIRCFLAKCFMKIQRRKRAEYEVACAITIQNAFRRKQSFDVFAQKKGLLEEGHRNHLATVIQATFRMFRNGRVPARKLLRIELHRAMKCLAGRGPLHRVPVLPGLFASEHRRFERALQIVTHPGTPFNSMATEAETRGAIRVCWRVIERREQEGARQKEKWVQSKREKEQKKMAELEAELQKHKAKDRERLERERALEEADHLDEEEAEAARRMRRRLEKEIEAMREVELTGAAGERERMAREERFQRQYVDELETARSGDVLLELSAMETEDRHMKDIMKEEKVWREKDLLAEIEAEHLKDLQQQEKEEPSLKRSNRIRFHRKPKNNGRYFKNVKNRRDYLSKRAEEKEKQDKAGQRVPVLPPPPRRVVPADFSKPPPQPCVIKKIGHVGDGTTYVKLSAQPLPAASAAEALDCIEKIKRTKDKYNAALKDVAAERGELVRCQDELDDAEDFLVRLKAKTRNERMEARQNVLDLADDVAEQQLAVDDAEAALMMCAKAMVRALVDAAKEVDASDALEPFRFDLDQSKPDTLSSTSMTAAREWLRQLANWCSGAEAKIKISVGDRYIACLTDMGVISNESGRKSQTPSGAGASDVSKWFTDAPAPLAYLETAQEQGVRMLEEASLKDIIVTLKCECDYLVSGYSEANSHFFLADEIVSGKLVFDSETLLDKSKLPEDSAAGGRCLSAVVRDAMLEGRASVQKLREEVLAVKEGGAAGMAEFQATHVRSHCNSAEAKRIRGFIKKLLPTVKEAKDGADHDEDIQIDGQTLKVGVAVGVLEKKVADILKEFELNGGGDGGDGLGLLSRLVNAADEEAEELKRKELAVEEEERKRREEYEARHKKKGISGIGLVWMEKKQAEYELGRHRRELEELLKRQPLDLTAKRRGEGKDKKLVGGGIYLFPQHSPEKLEQGKGKWIMEGGEGAKKKVEKTPGGGKWRKKAMEGGAGGEAEAEEEARELQEQLAAARLSENTTEEELGKQEKEGATGELGEAGKEPVEAVLEIAETTQVEEEVEDAAAAEEKADGA